jgi:hypothetical protein
MCQKRGSGCRELRKAMAPSLMRRGARGLRGRYLCQAQPNADRLQQPFEPAISREGVKHSGTGSS